MYYIYKDKYNKEINSLNTENRIKLDYKKSRLADDYEYLSEEEQEEKQEEKLKEEQEEEREEKQKEEQEEKQKEEQEEEQEEKQKEEQEEEQEEIFPINSDDKTEQQTSKKLKDDAISLNKWIIDEEENINKELFKNYFLFQTPYALLKDLYQTNDKEKNNKLVNVINSGLKDLKEEIKKMPKEEKEIEEPDVIVEIAEDILEFNKQKQKQEGQGIKILTPNQMLSRLPISLAQLKAGINSEKLKNEIRQLLYSLYRSKNITISVYNNLIKPI